MVFTVASDENNLSVADFLQKRVPAAPQGYLRQLQKKGKVLREAEPLGWLDRLYTGDAVRLPDSSRLQHLCDAQIPVIIDLPILYESREILIVDKPSGLAVHSSLGHEKVNLTALVEEMLERRGVRFSVAPVHRLDLETSGPVMFGKGQKACTELGKMFMRHEVDKYYLALVAGITPESGRLCSDVPSKGKIKEAVTDYRTVSRNERASLLELRLETGRQHQIRRQLAQSGHPIYGDQRYGGPSPKELPRMYLHCAHISFIDPFSGAQLDIESVLPQELEQFFSPQMILHQQKAENKSDIS